MIDLTNKNLTALFAWLWGLVLFLHDHDKRSFSPERICTCPVVFAEMAWRSELPRSRGIYPLASPPQGNGS